MYMRQDRPFGEHFGDSKFMAVYYVPRPTCHPKGCSLPMVTGNINPKMKKR